MKLLNLILILFTFVSCFSDSGDEESGGGLFSNHKPVINAFNLNLPTNSTYIAGEVLNFQVSHPYPLTVTGAPRLQIDLGGSTVTADYVSGSGTNNLIFTYTITGGDNDNNGIDIIGSTVDLNGGTIQFDLAGTATNATLALPGESTSGILVDTQAPTTIVTIPTNIKTYYLGQTLQFIVNFDEAVDITGTPVLELDFNGTVVDATYNSGSGSNSLTFTYDVIATDIDLDGIVMNTPLVLNGGTIADAAGNAANLTLTPIPMPTTYVNGDAPFVASFNLPTEKTYYIGQMLQIDLVFNELVNIIGIPSIDFNLGSATKTAFYLGGTGTNTITFNYIVALDDVDSDGIIFGNIIDENGGTIQDAGGAGAILSISPPLTPNVLINGSIPTITSITPPTDANYLTGQDLDFTVSFDENVIVTNIPRIEIAFASGNVFANYQSGTGTKNLVFRYSVLAGNNDNDGILFATTGLDLNTTGTITSLATTQNADLLYNALEPTMTGVKVNEVTATQLVITTEPVNTEQNANITPAITVEIRDAVNALVATATDNVTLAFGTDPSAGTATLGGTITVAAVDGIATFSDINIDSINAGYTLVASSGVLTNATSASFDTTTPVPTQLAITTEPVNTIAGVAIAPSIVVEIQDASGNLVNTSTDNVTLAFGTDTSSGTATLGGTLTVAAVAGVANFSDITINKAFTGYTLSATSGALTLDTSSSFDITAAAASQLAYKTEPIDTDYNTNIAPAIEVEIQDAFGNKTTDTNSITLVINNNPNAGTLAGTTTVAATTGTASFNDIQIDNTGVGYTLNATSGGLTLATSGAFNIIAAPTQLTITGQPSNTDRDVDISPAITVEIRDANNNLVTDETSNVTLAIGTDPSAGAMTLAGTLTVAAVGGIATFNSVNLDTVNTGYTLVASSGVLTNDTSSSFNITYPAPTQLAITSEPSNAVAGVNITSAIVVEVRDAAGNLVETNTDNVTIAFGTDASSGTAILGGTLTVAAVAGVATFSDINIDKAFNSYTLNASSGVLTGASSATFNIAPATKAQLAFNVEPVDTNYNTNITPAIEVEIQDAFGNKTADTDSIVLAINNNPSTGTLAGTTTVAAIAGVANFSDIQIDNTGVGYTLNATSGGLTLATSAAFNIDATPTQLIITGQPNDADRDMSIAPAITVEIRDASNNLVTGSTDNVTLTFGTDPSAGAATLGGTLTVAAVGGIATFNAVNIDTVNTGYTLVASSGALTVDTSSAFNILMPAPTQLAITAQPVNTVAGVNITPSITVEIRDASGNLVETNTDNVTISFGTDASAGAATLDGTLTVAAVAGVATFSDINIDKAFNNYTFGVSSGVLSGATSSTFNITPAAKSQLAFSVEPSDTTNVATVNPSIVVDIQDAFGNKTTDTDSITLSLANDASAGSATLGGTLTIASSAGSATFSDININYAASGYTLNATSGSLSTATSASFNILQVPTKLVITQEPSDAQFNVAISPSIIVAIQDATSTTVAGNTDAVTLNFGTDPSAGSATIGGTKTVNAVNGVAIFNDISIDDINNGYTFTFSSGALTTATSTTFNIFDTTLVFDSVATVNFGNISLGDTADATLLINHSGGTASSITETTLAAPFDFKGGSYPGTGGTCSASITTNCTIILTYTPSAAVTSNGTVTIDYNSGNTTSRPLTGTGVSTTPTDLLVSGPTGVITNSCIPYIIQSVDTNSDVGNVTSNETVSLLINNGTGSFYSDSGCASSITNTIISNGTSSKTIYFESNTSAQSLTLIFNGSSLANTSKAVTTSVEPTFISANLPNEIVTDTCTLAEVSLVDPNGVKTGSSTSKTINITENGDVLVYTDSFCTNQVTALSYAAYEGSKFIYLKNATAEAVTFNFTDAGAVLTGDSSNVSFVSTLTWADTDYSKRVRIAINNLDIPDTFTNMPILVKIDSSKINYTDMLANGDDMRFYLDDHTTPLSYSIDTWNASGTSYIWVKVDSIAANSELNIYMYYSNGAATNNESSSTIWAAYEGVWLMNKSGATYVEETVNGRDGTANGSLTDIAGPVGNAVNFDGASTLKLTYDLAQVLGGTSTISFWMKTSQTGDNTDWRAPGLVGLSGTAASQDLFYSFINASGNIGSSAGGGTQVQSNFVVNDNTWRYVTVSRNSTTGEFRYYINGVLNGNGNSGTGLKTQPFYDFGGTTKLWGGGGFFYYIGGMDSIRISNSVQTDNRVKAEYKFTTDTHVQFSGPEDL